MKQLSLIIAFAFPAITFAQSSAEKAALRLQKEANRLSKTAAAARHKAESARAKSWQSGRRHQEALDDLRRTKKQLAKATEKFLDLKRSKAGKDKRRISGAQQQLKVMRLIVTSTESRVKAAKATWDATRRASAPFQQRYESLRKQRDAQLRKAQHAFTKLGKFVSFAKQVAPILAQRCLSCHSARSAKGKVDLENYEAIITNSDKELIAPGDSKSSLLLHAISDGSMPPGDESLSATEVQTLRRWIEIGAPLDAGLQPRETLWNLVPRRKQPPAPAKYRHPLPITALAFSPDGMHLATSGYHEILIWNLKTGKLVKRMGNQAERIFGLEFSPQGTWLAVASGTPGEVGEARLVSLDGKSPTRHLLTSQGPQFAIRFSHDGKLVASCGTDCRVRVFRVNDGSLVQQFADHHKAVFDIAWSPDGSRLATASRDKNAKVLDLKRGIQLVTYNKSFELNFGGRIYGVTFHPNGKEVISVGNDRLVRIWNAGNAKLRKEIKGYQGTIFRVGIVGDIIYSCSADKTVRLHNLATGKLIRRFDDHRDFVYSITALASHKLLASGSYDGEVRIRRYDTGKLVTKFVARP